MLKTNLRHPMLVIMIKVEKMLPHPFLIPIESHTVHGLANVQTSIVTRQ